MTYKCRCKTYGSCGAEVEKENDKCEYCWNDHKELTTKET